MRKLPDPGAHVHLIAICGVGMAALAGLLQERGYRVTGSDRNCYPPASDYLASRGIEVFRSYDRANLAPSVELAIIGNAVSRDNVEAQEVLARGIPFLSLPQALGEFLISDRSAIVIAGTHGKTTTASIVAWILDRAGWEPSFFIGGVPHNFGSGFRSGRGSWVVLEGDEYDSAFFDKGPKFLHYRPRVAILTSVEFDHADIYRDLEHVKEAFRAFVALIPPEGLLLACADFPLAVEIAGGAACRVVSYGVDQGDWSARPLDCDARRSRFAAFHRGRHEAALEIALAGRHNVANALAGYALGRELGLPSATLREALASFAGVRRRQELRGEAAGVTVVDDFAHHPTAVRETVNALRSAYPGRRLWAVFEPRSQTSRRNVFAHEFARALALADRVIVAGLYEPEKIPAAERLSPEALVEAICRERGAASAAYVERAADIPAYLGRELRPGDLVVIMSNGGFDGVQGKLLEELKRMEESHDHD